MAGIYIHIPFCRQACHYCDFHFSTNLRTQSEMVSMICKEISLRHNYVDEVIDTIYFGGGTPSLLSAPQIQIIIDSIRDYFLINGKAEITFEANPEDLSSTYLYELLNIGINRLSIGVQTFHNEKLKWMNRAHSSNEAQEAFLRAREAGFQNISIDLIYARPDENTNAWTSDLERVVSLNPDHISLYGLTIEEKTVFGKWEKDKKLIQLPEESAAAQYLEAITYLNKNEFAQYEVSNFSKTGFESKHNGAYWRGVPYLGVGPGAHSFDGKDRHINIRNNSKYLKFLNDDQRHYKTETLTKIQRINEQILTSLRTINGLDFDQIKTDWGVDILQKHQPFIDDLCNKELALLEDNKMRLLPNGFLIADEISLHLFFDE